MTKSKLATGTPKSTAPKPTGNGEAATRKGAPATSGPVATAQQSKNDDLAGKAAALAGEARESVRRGIDHTRSLAADAASAVADGTAETLSTAQKRAEAAYRATTAASRHGVRKARAATSSAGHAVEGYFEENPLMIAAIGFVGGMALGSLLPRTRHENRYMGEWRDEMVRRGLRYSRETSAAARMRAEQDLRNLREQAEDEMQQAMSAGQTDGSHSASIYGVSAGDR